MPSPDRSRRELRNRAKLALWLALPFIGLMLLVSPRGDFPLNDDWVYAKMVQALVNQGHFGLSPFSNAYALTQTLYAAPLAKLFGFSFTLLRLTTIFMGWITVCFTAFTARELGLSNGRAMLAATAVLVNPLFVNLCYTFMTDVPFCAFVTISAYYFVKTLRAPTIQNLLLGTLFSVAAFYNRQLGALIPIAFVLAFFARNSKLLVNYASTRHILVLTSPWVAAIVFAVLMPEPNIHIETLLPQPQFPREVLYRVFDAVPLCVLLLGLFLLPLSALICVNLVLRTSWNFSWNSVICPITLLLTFCASTFGLVSLVFGPPQIIGLPISLNTGPMLFSLLYQWDAQGAAMVLQTPLLVKYTLLLVSSISVTVAVHFMAARQMNKPVRRGTVSSIADRFILLLAAALAIVPILAAPGPFYDRYLLAALPPGVLFVTRRLPLTPHKGATAASTFTLAVFATYSVIGLQDYMAWNTARWKVIDYVRTELQAQPNIIDGGFEFNGMYTSEEFVTQVTKLPIIYQKPWWVVGNKFCVLPATRVFKDLEIMRVQYFSWLGFTTRYMCALQLSR